MSFYPGEGQGCYQATLTSFLYFELPYLLLLGLNPALWGPRQQKFPTSPRWWTEKALHRRNMDKHQEISGSQHLVCRISDPLWCDHCLSLCVRGHSASPLCQWQGPQNSTTSHLCTLRSNLTFQLGQCLLKTKDVYLGFFSRRLSGISL